MCTLTYITNSSIPTSNLSLFNPHCHSLTHPNPFTALKSDILKSYLPIPSYLPREFGFFINATINPDGSYANESFLFHYGEEYGNATSITDSAFPDFWVTEVTKIPGGLSFFHRIPFKC